MSFELRYATSSVRCRFVTGSRLALLAFLIGGCQRSSMQRRDNSNCRYGEWSPPRTAITSDGGSAAVVRWPSVATVGDRAYVAGTEIAFFTADPVHPSPITFGALGSGRLAPPVGTFRFAYPRLIADGRGGLHLVWAEPADGATPIRSNQWTDQKLTTVWTAAYRPEGGWTIPRKVLTGDELLWSNAVIADDDAVPRHWALSVVDRSSTSPRSRIMLVRFERDSLVASEAPTPSKPAYSSVAAGGRSVFLGFIAPALNDRPNEGRAFHDRNSVWFQSSPDGGATWRPATVVSRSGSNGAHHLKTLVAPAGTLHLLWMQTREGARDVIRHVASRDGGTTWSAPDDLEPPPQLAVGFEVAVDACGKIHVVYEHLDGTGTPHVDYATWQGHWSPVRHLFPEVRVTGTTLHHAADGRLVIAFLAQPADGPMYAPTTAMYTELRPRR